MDIISCQMLSLVGLFASMAASFLLPHWWLRRKPESFGGSNYHTGLSLANCISGGVFIATFFVGLMPEVRDMFCKVFELYEIQSHFPVTELVIFLGFILSLGIEQCVLSHQEKKATHYTSIPSVGDDSNKTELVTKASSLKDEKIANEVSTMIDYDSDTSTKTPSLASKDSAAESNHTSGCMQVQVNEHSGHSHAHGHAHCDITNYLKAGAGLRLGMLMVSLGVHSLFEGLALGLQTSVPILINLMIGVGVHELLVAFAMGVNVSRLKLPAATVIKLALVFSASIPVGQIIGLLIGFYHSNPTIAISAILQGLAAGTFIHVTFLEVIPAEFQENSYRILKVVFIGIGFLLLLGCSVIMENVVK